MTGVYTTLESRVIVLEDFIEEMESVQTPAIIENIAAEDLYGIIDELECGDLVSTLEETIFSILNDTASPPPSQLSSPPPPVPTWQELTTQAQPAQSEGHGWCLPQGAGPHSMTASTSYQGPQCQKHTMYPDPWYDQAAANIQGQVRY